MQNFVSRSLFMRAMRLRWVAVALGSTFVLPGASEAGAFHLRVLDAARGRPVAGASVAWRVGDGKSVTLSSDSAGKVKISVPRKAAGTVHVTATKRGFAPMTMWWEANKVPAKFDLLLPEAQTIGGRVTGETGNPVAGASITLNFPQRLAGPRVAVEEFVVKSDADGRWRCDSMPKDAAYVFVEVWHPEFDSPSGEVALEALRAGTAELKLFAVATLRGQVLDDTGRAVPDAEVMLGGERDIWPSSSTLATRTEAEGRFEFRRVHLEKRLLGVHAPEFAPTMQSIAIKRESAAVEIRLKPGAPFRVRVVDHAGQPIAGVAAKVNEWPSGLHSGGNHSPGRWAYPGWEWETDAQGRFTWSNAPHEMVLWSFTKGGYMSRGHHGLNAAPEEQVVKLGLPFRISGSVTDAASGQAVNEFVLTPRFAQTYSVNANTLTNFGGWEEYNRKRFSDGKFSLYYEYPLLSGSQNMHDWQVRVEADGYDTALSRLVRDEERGARLDFQLQPRPLPKIPVTAPAGAKRVTAGVAAQPSTVRPGESFTLFVKARIAPGHHIYALEDSGCSNLPTSLDAALPGVLAPDGPWRGSEPKQHDDGSRTLADEVLFKRRFLIERGAGGKTHKLPATLRFQVCNEALCWPPETISLETQFEVIASPE
jgi:hypothetical protein